MNVTAPDRGKVLWLGPTRAEHHLEYAHRGLSLSEVDLENYQEDALDFAHSRGLVLCAMTPKVSAVNQAVGCVVQAVNHGLYVLVLVGDSLAHKFVQDNIEKVLPAGPARERVRYRIGAPAHEIAELFARHHPGPAINRALKIESPKDLRLTELQEFLLQRAFSDCASISLTPMPGGRSALTLLVQATLTNSLAGPHPLPFFAKLDRAAQIVTERACYERYAESHIAWYLRPNLQPARCLIGANAGILVGSFVPKSESLWSLILQGRAERAIKSLFNDTLAGWRDPVAAAQFETGSIAPSLAGVFAFGSVRKRYVAAATAMGFSREPQQVWEEFLNLPTRNWPRAPIHGDMHAENVRVRGGDAIIIDLARVTMGPPAADPACLEVWISFQMPPPEHPVDQAAWLETVRELFAFQNVIAPPEYDATVPLAWMRDAVIHTRRVALTSSPGADYAITLALYLLRRAMFEPDATMTQADQFRRTWAWILGCQLLESVQQRECLYKEAA